MHYNEKSVGEIIHEQQIIVHYHGKNVSSSIKLSHAYQRARLRSSNNRQSGKKTHM